MKKMILAVAFIMNSWTSSFANDCYVNGQRALHARTVAEQQFQFLYDELSRLLEVKGDDNIYALYHDAYYGKCDESVLTKISKAVTLYRNFDDALNAIAEYSAKSYEAYTVGLCSEEDYAKSANAMQAYFVYRDQSAGWTKFIKTILVCLESK